MRNRKMIKAVIVCSLAAIVSAGCMTESPPQIYHKNIYTSMGCFAVSSSMDIFLNTGREIPGLHNCYVGFDEINGLYAVTATTDYLSEMNISVTLPDGSVSYVRNLRAGKCDSFFGIGGALCLEGDHSGFYNVSVNYPGKQLMFPGDFDWDRKPYYMTGEQLDGESTEIIVVGKIRKE